RMGGSRIQVKILLLDVLAMIPFGVREPEQALLQNGIRAVPQCERQAHQLFGIGYARDSILAPSIGAAARMVVRKVFPGGAVGAVVLAHGAPLPFAQIRTPVLPAVTAGHVGEHALPLAVHRNFLNASVSDHRGTTRNAVFQRRSTPARSSRA